VSTAEQIDAVATAERFGIERNRT